LGGSQGSSNTHGAPTAPTSDLGLRRDVIRAVVPHIFDLGTAAVAGEDALGGIVGQGGVVEAENGLEQRIGGGGAISAGVAQGQQLERGIEAVDVLQMRQGEEQEDFELHRRSR